MILDLKFGQIRSLDDSKTLLLLKSQASQNHFSVYQTPYTSTLTICWVDLRCHHLALPKTSPVVNSNMGYSPIWARFSFEAHRGCLQELLRKTTALHVELILALISFLTSMFFSQIVKLCLSLWPILPKRKKATFRDYFFTCMVSLAVWKKSLVKRFAFWYQLALPLTFLLFRNFKIFEQIRVPGQLNP